MSYRLLTMNQMSEMTGIDRRTVKKRVEGLPVQKGTGNGHYYDAREALPLLYQPDGSNQIEKRLKQEELKYETARVEKMQIEVGKLRGELIPIEEVARVVEKEYAFVKSQFRAIPSKLAKPLTATLQDPHAVHKILQEAIDECLSELTADATYEQQRIDIEQRANNTTEEEPSVDADSSTEAQPS